MTSRQFETLLRVRRHRRDQVRTALARSLTDGRAVEEALRQVEAGREDALSALKQATAGGGVDVDQAAAWRYHALRLSSEAAGLIRAAAANAERTLKVRALLTRAERDVKAAERLREHFEAAGRREEERRADRDATDRFSAVCSLSGDARRDASE